jgi:hypothetical protein
MGWCGLIDLAQDRDQWKTLVNTPMDIRVPQNVGQMLSNYTSGGLCWRVQLRAVSYLVMIGRNNFRSRKKRLRP